MRGTHALSAARFERSYILFFGWMMVSKSNRIQSRELLLESGIARRVGKQLLVVLGLFQRQLQPQSAGTFYLRVGFST